MSLNQQLASFALAVALFGGAGAIAADTYKVDGAHSFVVFKVKHLNVGHAYGRFNQVEGSVVLDEAKPESSTIHVTVKTDSVDTANAKRDAHLKGPDFFNVKEFPTIEFKSKSVKKNGEDYEATGDLTLHGVTKEQTVTFKKIGAGKDPWGGTRAGAEAHFTIKRSEFGMKFMLEGVSDEVEITVAVEGVKEK